MSKQSTHRRKSATSQHKRLSEDDFESIVDDWIAKHPHIKIDEKQRRFMIRVQLMIQKAEPGWYL